MSSSNLLRWSGSAALVGGALLAILSILDSVLFGDQPASAATASSAWIIVEVAFIVAEILIVMGLVGLYARQAEQAGSLGLIAFLVTFFGTVMLSGVDWSAAFFGSWLAGAAPELVDTEPSGAFLAGFFVTLALVALGWFLFGLASLQAGVLPRAASVLLMVGAVLTFVLIFLELPFEVAVLGVAIAWMGYALRSGATDAPGMIAETAA